MIAGQVRYGDGAAPTIALINQATGDLGVGWDALVTSLKIYVERDVAPVWGTPCNLVVTAPAQSIPLGAWALRFVDSADVANALGYHDLTPEGLPLAYVFVETAKQAGEQVSVTAAHELVEMLVDPDIALAAQAPDGGFYAYEAADPVQEDTYGIEGVAVSNFIYPSYFEAFRAGQTGQKYDHMSVLTAPFSLAPGGYMPIWKDGGWTQIFGSEEKKLKWLAGPRQRLERRQRFAAKRVT